VDLEHLIRVSVVHCGHDLVQSVAESSPASCEGVMLFLLGRRRIWILDSPASDDRDGLLRHAGAVDLDLLDDVEHLQALDDFAELTRRKKDSSEERERV
jgi:hypothetical protein